MDGSECLDSLICKNSQSTSRTANDSLKSRNLEIRLSSLYQYNWYLYLLNHLPLLISTNNRSQVYLIYSFLNMGKHYRGNIFWYSWTLQCSKYADTVGIRNVRIFSLGKYFHINYNIAWLIIHTNIHCTWSTTHFTVNYRKKTFFSNRHCT